VVLEESQETRVVGEDLGTVPDYVRPSLRSLGIAGFKIPQWESYPDGRTIQGSDYQRLSVATYATHDHKPVRALWQDAFEETTAETEQAGGDLAKIAIFAGIPAPKGTNDFDRDFYAPIMEALFRCESWIALVMITDLLARKDRFNVPGTATSSNWSRRMGKTVEDLRKSRRVRHRMQIIRQLLEKAGRI
jgi:4-alpha-glucanotransferase